MKGEYPQRNGQPECQVRFLASSFPLMFVDNAKYDCGFISAHALDS